MEDLSLHILDIAENSIDAGATAVNIGIREDAMEDTLTLVIGDNGRGMGDGMEKKAADSYFTTKTGKRFGLGIPLLEQAAGQCGGGLSIASGKEGGTTITASFRLSNADMLPLGDIGATMATLIMGHPDVDYALLYEKGGLSYAFDTRGLRSAMGDVPINLPVVVLSIRDDINESIFSLMKSEGGRKK